jgi:hypothetical protein
MSEQIDLFTAIMIAERADGYDVAVGDVSEERYLEAWQMLVDTGAAWRLQGFFGRTAARMIEDGLIQPKKTEVHL